MVITSRENIPLALDITSPCPHEVTLVEQTLNKRFLRKAAERIIGDKAYDSDELDGKLLRKHGIRLIAPHKRNRRNKTQDGRELRRYRRRWKVEQLFA